MIVDGSELLILDISIVNHNFNLPIYPSNRQSEIEVIRVTIAICVEMDSTHPVRSRMMKSGSTPES